MVFTMKTTLIFIFPFILLVSSRKPNNFSTKVELLNCKGVEYKNVSLTAYYPDYDNLDKEKGYLDVKGKKLRTLQDFLDDRTEFVTVAIDENLNIPYGTFVCSPELNKHFGRFIKMQVRDVGSELKGFGFTRLDICVRSEVDSYDLAVNREITLVF